MNSSRPSVARKVTPKVEADRRAAIEQTTSVRIDGTVYTVRAAEITGLMERDFRAEVGMSIAGLLNQLFRDPGLDSVAAFMWLARLLAGDKVTYTEQLEKLNYATEVVVDDPDTEPAPAPEA